MILLLGVLGGLFVGVVVGLFIGRRRSLSVGFFLDARDDRGRR